MDRIYCIIDACSYIYLNQFSLTFSGRNVSLYDLLNQSRLVTLKHSRTIADEIKRNQNITASHALKIDSYVYNFIKPLGKFDQAIFSNSISSSAKDKGEKENVAVAIDMFLHKKNSIIYLSDDKKATGETGHLKEVMNTFPYYQIWSSFEVILFLYLFSNRRGFDYSIALDLIQDMIAFKFNHKRKSLVEKRDSGMITPTQFSLDIMNLNKEAQNYRLIYTNRVNLIRNLISNL